MIFVASTTGTSGACVKKVLVRVKFWGLMRKKSFSMAGSIQTIDIEVEENRQDGFFLPILGNKIYPREWCKNI